MAQQIAISILRTWSNGSYQTHYLLLDPLRPATWFFFSMIWSLITYRPTSGPSSPSSNACGIRYSRPDKQWLGKVLSIVLRPALLWSKSSRLPSSIRRWFPRQRTPRLASESVHALGTLSLLRMVGMLSKCLKRASALNQKSILWKSKMFFWIMYYAPPVAMLVSLNIS